MQSRWKVKSVWQVVLILFVFACTGFTVMYLKRTIIEFLFHNSETGLPWWIDLVYYLLILPVYQIFLLIYGFLFGQFKFFLEFEKKFLKRVKSWFTSNKIKDEQ